ncbi:zinc-ribbon domain-containing protein, partial [Candidatus Bathyarchaeota archaeon]|nr:zinc-ribbon domain-containing protein [Candidatus Bathyarchaeota archaeon]
MPFCNKCGAELKEDAKFCLSCGTPVTSSAPSTPTVPTTPQFPQRSSRPGGITILTIL